MTINWLCVNEVWWTKTRYIRFSLYCKLNNDLFLDTAKGNEIDTKL